jgi:hypothetical protein
MLTKDEKQRYFKAAEKCVAEGEYGEAGGWYKLVEMFDKSREYYAKEAEKSIAKGSYYGAAGWYKLAEMTDKTIACWAKLYLDKKDYKGMAERLSEYPDFSLSQIPKETQERLLELVRKGNVAITRGLAKLVQTEEDELLFNEARAGLVL